MGQAVDNTVKALKYESKALPSFVAENATSETRIQHR